MGVNDDLFRPLESETFANTAHRASATFSSGGTNGTSGAITATIVYEANSDTYFLTTPTGSIGFGPGDIDPTQTDATVTVYEKVNGATTDTLTLTKPGTSGQLTYQYVGGAFWQQTTQTGPTDFQGAVDAIVYGVPTPAGSIPISGAANYDIDLVGARTDFGTVLPLAGEGVATVDFLDGNLIIVGEITLGWRSTMGLGDGIFFGSAAIGADGAFSGTLVIEDYDLFQGQFDGGFFGPAASEIGAAFSAANGSGTVAVGALLGRQGRPDTPNESFALGSNYLANSESFEALQATTSFDFNGSVGSSYDPGQFSNLDADLNTLIIRFDQPHNRYLLLDDEKLFNYSLSGSDFEIVSLNESATWRQIDSFGDHLRIWRFDYWGGAGAEVDYRYSYQLYGMPTHPNELVRAGTAGYAIDLAATIADNEYRNPFMAGGSGDLFVDLTTGRISAYVALDYNMITYSPVPFETAIGAFLFDGMLSSTSNAFNGDVELTGLTGYSGTASGQFFGPAMEEVGAVFVASGQNGAQVAGTFFGLGDNMVGDPGAAGPTLADLANDTSLSIYPTDLFEFNYTELKAIRYDAASGGYIVEIRHGHELPLNASTYNSAASTADTRVYEGIAHDNRTFTAELPNLDSGTSPIALTYSMITKLFYGTNDPDRQYIREYMVGAVGLETKYMPRSGTANYNAVTHGYAYVGANVVPANKDVFLVNGTANFSVDFGDQSITGTFSDFEGTRIYASNPAAYPDTQRTFEGFSTNAVIDGGLFSVMHNQGVWSNAGFEGGFFGPNADEIGGTVYGVQGSQIDPENIELNAAFIGTKE